jgi:hypothetical protein
VWLSSPGPNSVHVHLLTLTPVGFLEPREKHPKWKQDWFLKCLHGY